MDATTVMTVLGVVLAGVGVCAGLSWLAGRPQRWLRDNPPSISASQAVTARGVADSEKRIHGALGTLAHLTHSVADDRRTGAKILTLDAVVDHPSGAIKDRARLIVSADPQDFGRLQNALGTAYGGDLSMLGLDEHPLRAAAAQLSAAE